MPVSGGDQQRGRAERADAGEGAPAIASEIDEASRGLELADPDADAHPLDRAINRVAEVTGVLLLTAILLIVFGNAIGRYLLNSSIVWAEEVVITLIPWLAVLGLFLSARRGQMIRVEFFTNRLGPRAYAIVRALGQVLCIVAFAYLAFVAFNYVSVFGRDPTPYLGWPKGLSSSALVIGAGLVALAFVVALIREGLRPGAGDTRRP